MTDEEAVARAILKCRQDRGASGLAEWDSEPRWVHELYAAEAHAAIAALTALGWQKIEPGSVVVPVEPTEAMKNAVLAEGPVNPYMHPIGHARSIYRAMIAANKKPTSGGDADGPGST